jgi:beta-lactamase class D
MGGAYRTYEEEERCMQVFGEKPEVRCHLENIGADGTIILERNFKKWDGELLDWISVAQDTDRWRAVVNTAMNLRVP